MLNISLPIPTGKRGHDEKIKKNLLEFAYVGERLKRKGAAKRWCGMSV